MAENRNAGNSEGTADRMVGAIGDSSDPRAAATDPNGAETAVGVPHPENRGLSLDKVIDMEALSDVLPELDDYDAERAAEDVPSTLPPDEDDGRSFEGLADVGERAGVQDVSDHEARRHSDTEEYTNLPGDDMALSGRASNTPENVMQPTLDNQINQPERFQRSAQKQS